MFRKLCAALAISMTLVCVVSFSAPTTANLWVDTDGGTCTRNSSPASYNSATACSSIEAALAVAATSGDVIVAKTGSYGDQTPATDKTGTTHIWAEAGATFGYYYVEANHTYHHDITMSSGSNHGQGWSITADDVTLDNFTANGTYVSGFIDAGSERWQILNSHLGNPSDNGARSCTNMDGFLMRFFGSSTIDTGLVQNTIFAPQQVDVTTCMGEPIHAETIRLDGDIRNITFDQVTFMDGAENNTGTVFFSTFLGGPPENITFQNSYFGTDGNNNIVFGGTGMIDTPVFLYNSFRMGFGFPSGDPVSMALTCNAGP